MLINFLDIAEAKKKILRPFEVSEGESEIQSSFQIDEDKFDSYSKQPHFWLPNAAEKHAQWVTRITAVVLDMLESTNNYFQELHAVCISKVISSPSTFFLDVDFIK